jgi:hypothetical protein
VLRAASSAALSHVPRADLPKIANLKARMPQAHRDKPALVSAAKG